MASSASILRRTAAAVLCALWVAVPTSASEELLSLEDAPAAVFPDADRFERREITATQALRSRIGERLAPGKTSTWERSYPVITAYRGDRSIGRAVVVEEIGKHRPITFIVGLDEDGNVAGVAVMAYREAYGGEVRHRRFLRQYEGKGTSDPLQPGRDVRNITGATLSARAIGRGIKKAAAVLAEASAPASGKGAP